ICQKSLLFVATFLREEVSLNAGIALWLLATGMAPARYRVSQGLSMGRAGRIEVEQVGDDVWIGGNAVTCIEGRLML
ncbi:hypothetical protein ACN6A8_13020, partial [Chromobacterium violaceum]